MVGCANRGGKNKGTRFFRLPSIIKHQGDRTFELSKKRQTLWLARIKRKDLTSSKYQYVRVRSEHFLSGAPAKLYDEANPDWAPSLKLGYERESETSMGRYDRAVVRTSRKRPAPESDDDHDPGPSSNPEPEDCFYGTPVQTDMRSDDIGILLRDCEALELYLEEEREKMEEERKRMQKQMIDVECKLIELTLNKDSFKDKDDKVLYYTGLNSWQLLEVVFRFVEPNLKKSSALTPFQQLLSTLMRLRLGLSGQDLAYRFRVHNATISRTFVYTLNVLYIHKIKAPYHMARSR